MDPLPETYAHNSVFALQENKFGRGIELEGAEVMDFLSGTGAAIVDNVTLGVVNQRESKAETAKDKGAFSFGEKMGDALSWSLGAISFAAGGAEAVVTTAGVISSPAAALGVGAMTYGTALMGKSAASLMSKTMNSEGSGGGSSNPNNGNTGKGKNHLKPDPQAKGPHSSYRTDPKTGKTTNTATYEPNPKNPKTGFDEKKRVDVKGKDHQGIPTPHVKEQGQKQVRPAKPNELPKQ